MSDDVAIITVVISSKGIWSLVSSFACRVGRPPHRPGSNSFDRAVSHMSYGRLQVEGSRLFDGSKEVMLRGVNLQYRLGTAYARPRLWDSALLEAIPRANVVRLVILHWDE